MSNFKQTLAEANPELAAQWHPTKNGGLTPETMGVQSSRKVWWLGECGHEWQASVVNRTHGTLCPYCAGRRVLVGFNDLQTTCPEIAAEWHPTKNGDLFPTQVSRGTHKRVWWLGKCGHEWETIIAIRASGHGCPYCSGNKLLIGFNDLATTHPDLAAEWHPIKNNGLSPSQVMAGSTKHRWWLGTCGHEWHATPYSRAKGSACPYCTGKRRLVRNKQSGEIYDGKTAAAKSCGGKAKYIALCCQGKIPDAYGIKWEYA